MRHLNGYRKLGRETSHRKAMLRNMATSFLTEGALKTTLQKAKELRPFVEKLITLTHKADVNAHRKAASILYTKEARKNLFSNLAERFKDRAGGYTRIVRLGERFGDGAEMCRLELVDFMEKEAPIKAQKRKDHLEKKRLAKEKEEEQQKASPMMTAG